MSTPSHSFPRLASRIVGFMKEVNHENEQRRQLRMVGALALVPSSMRLFSLPTSAVQSDIAATGLHSGILGFCGWLRSSAVQGLWPSVLLIC